MGLFDILRKPPIYYVRVGPDAPTQVLNYTALELYQTQSNLQAVVNYRAESIGQLPLKVYRRMPDGARQRDRTSVAARLIWQPNVVQTAFEFWKAVAVEYDVFGAVYVWVVDSADSRSGKEMYIIPSRWIISTEWDTVYHLSKIRVCANNGGMAFDLPASEVIPFRAYSPGNPSGYLSPLTALRGVLQEQIEAGRYRQELWHSSGRLNAQIIRPKDVKPWDDQTRRNWITAFRESWGSGGSKAGSIPLLEDGMEIKTFNPSFKEQQWAESVQLSREDVAAAYRINPALIWHTGTQTYASAKDNARALYAECLGPTIQMLQQRVNAFLFPMLGMDPDAYYCEFDFSEKLRGSFEERANIIQHAVGGPWMTIDEARALDNMPPLPDGIGAQIIRPLNVSYGTEQAVPDSGTDENAAHEAEPKERSGNPVLDRLVKSTRTVRIKASVTEQESESLSQVIARNFERQKRSVVPKITSGAESWWNGDRWDKELAEDMLPLITEISNRAGSNAAGSIGSRYVPEKTAAYLETVSAGRAHAINEKTRQDLEVVLEAIATEAQNQEPDLAKLEQPGDVFDKRIGAGAVMLGASLATWTAGWSTLEAGRQAKEQDVRKIVEKEWVTGANPRASHAAMNGQRVPIDSRFSNGADWPGDDSIGPAESCGCNCRTDVIITEVEI
ncbi:MAG: phage portal protein [Ruminiclostridium sp.]|nr:phage portal protein [Ruminiclostridium sp.]